MSFKDKLAEFFRGRYGNDQLNIALFCLYFLCVIIVSFTGWLPFAVLEIATAALILFRIFSRNVYKRSEENRKFMKLFDNVKRKVKNFCVSVRDFNKYRYRTCPKCRARLRLTKKRGKHTVKCPLCGNEFDVHII